VANDDENNIEYGRASTEAHSFKTRGWMPSGPGDPPGSQSVSNFSTLKIGNEILVNK
jgi:hypothetical protein